MRAFLRSQVLLLLALLGVVSSPLRADRGPVIPPPTSGEQCVAPTDIMRRDHMDLLTHQRDETVIDGDRTNPFSLIGCVNCHASRDESGQAIRIDAEGQFCQSCHAYAAVRIDCFSCHAALPEKVAGLPDTSLQRPGDTAFFNSELHILQAYVRGY